MNVGNINYRLKNNSLFKYNAHLLFGVLLVVLDSLSDCGRTGNKWGKELKRYFR